MILIHQNLFSGSLNLKPQVNKTQLKLDQKYCSVVTLSTVKDKRLKSQPDDAVKSAKCDHVKFFYLVWLL